MLNRNRIIRGIAAALLILILVYVGLGLGFHIIWTRAQAACRAEQAARGEFVEPEVFGGVLGLAFDVTWWPVYARANIRHFGDPFSTPCTRGEDGPSDAAFLDASRQALGELGLDWEEHALTGPPAPEPLTFEPVEGTQAAILARHEDQRAIRAASPMACMSRTAGPFLSAEPYTATTKTVEADAGRQVIAQVFRAGRPIYTLPLGDPCAVTPLWGLWVDGDEWILEVAHVEAREMVDGTSDRVAIDCVATGEIIRDGVALDEARGYEESFGYQQMDGAPFYFFRREGVWGVVYKGQEVPLGYTHIPHHQCCSGAELNPRRSRSMVAFFALRDDVWHYVEIGAFAPE